MGALAENKSFLWSLALALGGVLATLGVPSAYGVGSCTEKTAKNLAMSGPESRPPARGMNLRQVLLEVQTRFPGARIVIGNRNGVVRFDLVDADRRGMGYISYTVLGTDLSIGSIHVEEGYRGRGVSGLLYARILAEHPGIQRIFTALTEDNLHAYYAARTRGLSHLDALKETPDYRARARLGFSVIDQAHSGDAEGIPLLTTQRDGP